MQSLVRAMRGRGQEGRALPGAFPGLEDVGARVRYGQVTLIAGAPGSGKSALVLAWAMRVKVPTLYFSADSDRMTLGTRIGASITRHTTEEVEQGLIGPDASKWYALIDSHTEHIWFDWEPAPSLLDVEGELLAYAAVNGEWPGLVVIDNLKNVWDDQGDGDADHVRYDRTIARFNELAREYGFAVIVLHHVTGSYEDGYTPIPLTGLLGKPSKDVTLALTLYRASADHMGICVVKNRVGAADPGAHLRVSIPFVASRMWFGD